MSYYVKVETARGDRVVWGVDLERAVKESLTKPGVGEEVGLKEVGREPVKVRNPVRDADGKVTGERQIEVVRKRWVVERRDFFEARVAAAMTLRDVSIGQKEGVRKHPELVGTYLQIHAAELAAKRFRDPQDRELFVSKIRAALADSIARGEPLPAVRLRERSAERQRTPPEREVAPAR